MAEQVNSHSAMAKARHTDGLNVIFDQKSPGSSHSRSRSRSSSSSSSSSRSSRSSGSGHYKRRGRRDSSSSSSSSCSSSGSRSSSRSRSRSHPRCGRRSSRCRCDEHRGPVRRHYRRSPSRRYRAHSRSYSRSHTPDRYYRRRRSSRSRSRSSGRWSYYRRPVSPLRFRISPSPYRNYRSRSRSRTPVRAVSLSLDDKRKLLEAAKANAMKILGVEKIELPESVKPILSKQPEPRPLSPEPPVRRRRGSEETGPQDGEVEPEVSSPTMSTKRHIAFNTHNAMAKPTAAAPSPAKLTSRVDSFESRKPYGRWIPIGSRQSALK